MERRSVDKLFVYISNVWIIIMNDRRSVNVAADIGIQYSGDHRSRDASTLFNSFYNYSSLWVYLLWMEQSSVGDGSMLKRT